MLFLITKSSCSSSYWWFSSRANSLPWKFIIHHHYEKMRFNNNSAICSAASILLEFPKFSARDKDERLSIEGGIAARLSNVLMLLPSTAACMSSLIRNWSCMAAVVRHLPFDMQFIRNVMINDTEETVPATLAMYKRMENMFHSCQSIAYLIAWKHELWCDAYLSITQYLPRAAGVFIQTGKFTCTRPSEIAKCQWNSTILIIFRICRQD